MNAIWVLLQRQTWEQGAGFRAKEGRELESGAQWMLQVESAVQNAEHMHSKNRPSSLHIWWAELVPKVTSDRLPQVLLQEVSFGSVSTRGPIWRPRGTAVCQVITSLAEGSSTSRAAALVLLQTSRSFTLLYSFVFSICLCKAALININPLFLPQWISLN